MNSTHLRWPAERFYWALVDAPGLTRPGPLPIGLRSVFEEEVPVAADAADDLHAVCAPAGEGRAVVCAAPVAALRELPTDALRLAPESLPPFAPAIDTETLNLLVGAMEPRILRRARARDNATALAAVALCAGLVALGLLRRAAHWTDQATRARHAAATMLASLPDAPADLSAETARLQRIAHPHSVEPSFDAALAASSLLAVWPAQVPSKPQSIAVNGSGINVSVAVDGDPASFLKAFRAPEGWALDEPRLNTAGSVTRLSLHLRPEGGKP